MGYYTSIICMGAWHKDRTRNSEEYEKKKTGKLNPKSSPKWTRIATSITSRKKTTP